MPAVEPLRRHGPLRPVRGFGLSFGIEGRDFVIRWPDGSIERTPLDDGTG